MTDTDIPALIERLQHVILYLQERDAHGLADHVREAADAISRLTAFPLPDEVTGLIDRLHHWILCSSRDRQLGDIKLREDIEEAAAALQQQAQENERLNNGNEELKQMTAHFNGLNEFATDRIRELEADLKQHAELNAAEHAIMLQYRAERDAVEAKTINEILAQIPGGNICDPQEIADRIRALIPPAGEVGEKP